MGLVKKQVCLGFVDLSSGFRILQPQHAQRVTARALVGKPAVPRRLGRRYLDADARGLEIKLEF